MNWTSFVSRWPVVPFSIATLLISLVSLICGVVLQFVILPEEVWTTAWTQGTSDHPLLISYEHLVEGQVGDVVIRTMRGEDPVEDCLPQGTVLRSGANGQKEMVLSLRPSRAGV